MRETYTWRSRISQFLAWIGSPISTAFTWFWRYIWWLWGGILLAAFLGAITGVLGNFIYESITIHKYNPVDPHTWLLLTLSVLTTYPIQTTIGLALFVVFTVSIYIAKEAHFSHDNQANEYMIKRLAHVDPEKDNIGIEKYKKQAYLKRAEHDKARDILHQASTRTDDSSGQAIGICITGRPTQGKTRLAWETMCNALPKYRWTFIKWPLEPQYTFDLIALARGRKKAVLWLDDLHLFATPEKAAILNDLPRRFHDERIKLVIVATCRDGYEGEQAKKHFQYQLLKQLVEIHLEDISQEDAHRLAEQLQQEGVQVQKFDGTPGSLLLGVERMRDQRYPNLPKPAQQLLIAMKILHSAGIYTYPVPRVQGIAVELFERDTDLRDSDVCDDALAVLEAEDFVRLEVVSIEKRPIKAVKPTDVYLEQAVPNYPSRSADILEAWSILERVLARKFDATGLNSLGIAFNESLQGNPYDNKEHAKHCFQAALEVYTREQSPLDWARMKYNLANTLLDQAMLVEGTTRIELLEQAANTYHESLQVYSYEYTPAEWAQVWQKLGLVFSRQAILMEGEARSSLLKEAEQAFCDALKVYSYEQTPSDWARSQQNLGTTYLEQAQLEEATTRLSLVERATNAYREALGVYTKQRMLEEQADVQTLLGGALRQQVELVEEANRLALLLQAADAYQIALQIYSSMDRPLQWAQVHINLGDTLRDQTSLTERATHLSLLRQAADSYRAASQVYTFEHKPDVWIEIQNKLGDVLRDEANIAPRVELHNLFKQAEEAYRNTLKVYSPEYRPDEWAMTQVNLGTILSDQAELATGAEHQTLLSQAEEALRNALKVYSLEYRPSEWARIQFNLSVLHTTAASFVNDPAAKCLALRKAYRCVQQILEVFDQETLPILYRRTVRKQNDLKEELQKYNCLGEKHARKRR
ncbi:MAG TPA: hypothetical protein VEL31_28500 [Ktedonobacteraceae bacterium]|nr:hypothetical protein [Ktedonobacteraceae bacterium]